MKREIDLYCPENKYMKRLIIKIDIENFASIGELLKHKYCPKITNEESIIISMGLESNFDESRIPFLNNKKELSNIY